MPETKDQVIGTSADSVKSTPRKIRRWAPATFAFLLLAIQFVPYGRHHTNPPVTVAVAWDSRETESLVRGACFDCHSNETRWPWYSHVAPASWLVQSDVNEGRKKLNFSEGNLKKTGEVPEVVSEGEMPPWFYRLAHRKARLSSEEKPALMRGMRATFGDVVGTDGKDDHSD
jgi:mono/diheme cytochrome c family protein